MLETPRLHPNTIEEVKQRADIVDIIADHVVLRKRGKDFLGLCPFHEEKTPSFSVSPSKQLYYCFGCGAGGDGVKFLMELKRQSFSDVVLDLARRYQIPVQTLEPQQRQELQRQISLKEQLYEILAVTVNFYEHALYQPQGEIALNYLKSERLLQEKTRQKFQLGYAPAGWDTLYRYLVEVKKYPVDLVEQAGLIRKRKSGDGYYDLFRDRLIIPIHDIQGRAIAMGSRTLTDEQPKYLNSPETPLFDKGKTLFALNKAYSSIAKEDRVAIVEGYFDAIALHAVGIENVVASLGTALSENQIKLLLRYTESKQIVLNFDTDNAGIAATQRAIKEIESLVYAGQVNLRILNLPDGKDADDFLKHSHLETKEEAIELYRDCLLNAPLWLDWQLDRLLKDRDLKQADRFQQIAKNMVSLIDRLQDPNQRSHYTGYCAELLSQGDSRLIPMYVNNLNAQLKKPKSQPTERFNHRSTVSTSPGISIVTNPETELLETAEALLLRIYLHCPEHRQKIFDLLEEKELIFSLSHYRFLWQQILQIQDEIQLNQEQELILKQQSADNERDLLTSMVFDRAIDSCSKNPRIASLFRLDEKTQEDIVGAKQRIDEAIASLELVTQEKYQIYCLQQWQKYRPVSEEDIKRMRYYHQEYELAKQRIEQLKQLRLNT